MNKFREHALSLSMFLGFCLINGPPRFSLFISGGLGDEFLMTALCRGIKEHRRGPVFVFTRFPDLFAFNPDVDAVIPLDFGLIAFLQRFSKKLFGLNSMKYLAEQKREIPPPGHLIHQRWNLLGIRGSVPLQPFFFWGPGEKMSLLSNPRYVVIQTSVLAARLPRPTKNWFADRFQQVVQRLSGLVSFVQVGLPSDPLLKGALDLRGKTPIRDLARLLAFSRGFLGLEGFPMHLARSVGCPGVIVYGGHSHPSQTGYAENRNLFSPVPCAPCWRFACDKNMLCMRMIRVAEVEEAVKERFLS